MRHLRVRVLKSTCLNFGNKVTFCSNLHLILGIVSHLDCKLSRCLCGCWTCLDHFVIFTFPLAGLNGPQAASPSYLDTFCQSLNIGE